MTRLLLLLTYRLLTSITAACPSDMRPVGTFCMDVYEAPNLQGSDPLVMKSLFDAEAWCTERGKRVCAEDEWELACQAGGQDACNNDKLWRPFNVGAFIQGGPQETREIARLWQGAPSGAYSGCVSTQGIHDLIGNVEEWVLSRPGRPWRGVLKGGFWAKRRSCTAGNDAHEPTAFRFYETGFRCCF